MACGKLPAVDAHAPILALVTGRVVLGLVDVGVFPKEMAPLAEADTDVEDRFRFDLSNQMNDGRDRVGPAAGHAGPIRSRFQAEHDHPLVGQQAGEFRLQVASQAVVIVQPPKRRPQHRDKISVGCQVLAQPDVRLVAGRR